MQTETDILVKKIHPRGVATTYVYRLPEKTKEQRENDKKDDSTAPRSQHSKPPRKEAKPRSMSAKTARRIKNIACWIIHSYSRVNTFVVTLPPTRGGIPFFPDSYYQKRLSLMLETIRRKNDKFQYVFVCERQKRGAIHFHVICNTFIQIKVLRSYWCKHISELHQSSNNCITGVEKIRQSKGELSNYLAKTSLAHYLAKQGKSDTRDLFDCRTYCASQLASKYSEGVVFQHQFAPDFDSTFTIKSEYCLIECFSEKKAVEICNQSI